MRHPTVVPGKDFDLFIVDPDRVRKPNIVAHPIDFLHISDRTMPKFLQAELFFVFGLGKMRVEMDSIFTRKFGGLLH